MLCPVLAPPTQSSRQRADPTLNVSSPVTAGRARTELAYTLHLISYRFLIYLTLLDHTLSCFEYSEAGWGPSNQCPDLVNSCSRISSRIVVTLSIEIQCH